MQPPYIPPREADLFTWAANFESLIDASPATYGLTSSDATAISAVVLPFLAAYTTALNPSTRTGPSVAAKDAARAAMLAVVRPYAIQIRDNAGVPDQDKLDLGLNIPSTSRTPTMVPQTAPLLSVVAALPLTHTLRFADTNSPDQRLKPFGAKALYVGVAYSAVLVSDPADTTPARITNSALAVPSETGLATRQPFAVHHDPSTVGMMCTFFGRWVGVRGDNGPWSLPVAMIVAATSSPTPP